MSKRTPRTTSTSMPTWETLEAWARLQIQEKLQDVLEEEVTAFLGRENGQRRAAVDAERGYRNGYQKPRHLSMSGGTITVRRPRVRDVEERFESRLLPLFRRRTEEVAALWPELYLHGLSQGDFELALRGLLGEGAPLPASSIERLKARWQAEYEAWTQSRLDDLDVVYVWADGIYVKAGLEREKACLLVVCAALADGTKRVLAVRAGYRESTESWKALLLDLKARGLEPPKLQARGREELCAIPYATTRK
ncbi:MAG: transposase, partial [Candidatus Latescibacteria bacterium]|nr:transposase [Candidatus Latescibacterota bacterium]